MYIYMCVYLQLALNSILETARICIIYVLQSFYVVVETNCN